MLDEARADMEALAQDAKAVPFQATTLNTQFGPEQAPSTPPPAAATGFDQPSARPFEPSAIPKVFFESVEPAPFDAAAKTAIESTGDARIAPEPRSGDRAGESPIRFESLAELASSSPSPSRVLLSSTFPSDAVPVPPGRSLRTIATLVLGAVVIVAAGSFWWLRGHAAASASTPEATPSAAASSGIASKGSAPSAPVTSAPVLQARERTAPLSMVVEARRSSWIRTTVDGESDSGRTYAAGEKVQLNAKRGIGLRVGDAGAVFVSVNKGTPVPLGQRGQVMTKQFVAETAAPAGADVGPAPASGPSTPKQVAPPPSVPTASIAPPAPVPVPLVQSPASGATAAVAPSQIPAPALSRNDATPVALPRTESALVPPSPAPSPAAPAAAPAAGGSFNTPTTAVVAAARQWLDAYHRQERSAMAALSTDSLQLADERRADERFPANVEVNRSLDRVSVQIAADTAVLTAVMTERGDAGVQRISPISQVWILSGGQWRVKQVRLVSEARLNQIFR
jgi:uncharacterized protein DUF4115